MKIMCLMAVKKKMVLDVLGVHLSSEIRMNSYEKENYDIKQCDQLVQITM